MRLNGSSAPTLGYAVLTGQTGLFAVVEVAMPVTASMGVVVPCKNALYHGFEVATCASARSFLSYATLSNTGGGAAATIPTNRTSPPRETETRLLHPFLFFMRTHGLRRAFGERPVLFCRWNRIFLLAPAHDDTQSDYQNSRKEEKDIVPTVGESEKRQERDERAGEHDDGI